MPARQNWGQAYLAQALADLDAARQIGVAVPSALCMLLQMALEKLSKAFRCVYEDPFDSRRLQSSHKGAYAMVSYLQVSRNLKGCRVSETLRIGAKENLKFVMLLEALQPANAKNTAKITGQLEYPWQDQYGKIRWPAKHLDIVKEVTNPRARSGCRPMRLIKFATELADQIDEWLEQP